MTVAFAGVMVSTLRKYILNRGDLMHDRYLDWDKRLSVSVQ